MNTMLDLLGSAVIGGLLLLTIVNFTVLTDTRKFESDMNVVLHRSAKEIAEVLNYDLRKVGYYHSGVAITAADSVSITYRADLDSNFVAETVRYSISDSTALTQTENPRDILLYRTVDGAQEIVGAGGLVDFRLSYFDSEGVETAVLADIAYIKVEIWVESEYLIDGEYLFTYWEMTINPRNI